MSLTFESSMGTKKPTFPPFSCAGQVLYMTPMWKQYYNALRKAERWNHRFQLKAEMGEFEMYDDGGRSEFLCGV